MVQSYTAILFDNQTGAAIGSPAQWTGGRGVFSVAGAFGSTSVTLEYMGPNALTWLPVQVMGPDAVQTTVAFTASGMFMFDLPPGRIRARANGGTPSSLFARADTVPY